MCVGDKHCDLFFFPLVCCEPYLSATAILGPNSVIPISRSVPFDSLVPFQMALNKKCPVLHCWSLPICSRFGGGDGFDTLLSAGFDYVSQAQSQNSFCNTFGLVCYYGNFINITVA